MDAERSSAIAYAGPEPLRRPIEQALGRVVDPELSLSITDVGLVVGVEVDEHRVRVALTMTSAACPVADVIVDEVETELDAVLPPSMRIEVELVWEPPWTSERMSDRAREFMGW